MQALLLAHFRRGATAVIGCGSGRDTAWLVRQFFPVTGYDASEGLLAEAHRRYPALDFRLAALPDLTDLKPGSFTNVLCETLIMHLPTAAVAATMRRLSGLLAPGGTLYLSWRVTPHADRRDEAGRLDTAFDASLVFEALGKAAILSDDEGDSASSGKPVRRIIAHRSAMTG